MIIAGLTGAFLTNYVLAMAAGKSTSTLWMDYAAWRWMFWMQVFPASVFLLILLTHPGEPAISSWRAGRYGEAKSRALAPVRRRDGSARSSEIRRSIAADHHRPSLGI